LIQNAALVEAKGHAETVAGYTVESRCCTDDLNGPPDGVAESVFDEYDQEGCSLEFDS
jgi:hypothetical protein